MPCCVPFCESSTEDVSESKGIRFYAFPCASSELASWLRALGIRDRVPAGAAVCSRHFLREDMCGESLRAGAVPITVQVCMICLDTDNKMFSMSKYKLEEAYEHLTGFPLFDLCNLKNTLCVECAQRLRTFNKFRHKSLTARTVMMDLVKQNEVITMRHFAAVRSLKSGLARSTLVEYTFNPDMQFEVKTEPAMDMQWENVDVNVNIDVKAEQKPEESAKFSDDSIAWDAKLMNSNLCRVLLTRMPLAEERALVMRASARAMEGCSAAVAPFPASLTNTDENNISLKTEEEETIYICEQISVSGNDEVGTESCHYYNDTRDTPCTYTCDRWRKSGEAASEQDHLLTVSRKTVVSHLQALINDIHSSSHVQTTHQDELPDSEFIEPVYAHTRTTVEKVFQNMDNHELNIKRQEYFVPSYIEPYIGGKKYICDICQKNYKYKKRLIKHIIAHTGVKRFVCKLCHYICTTNSHLLKHMRGHTAEKSFLCEVCNYKCTRNSYLLRHMRTHTGEKPFPCKLCNYKGTQNAHLLEHMRTHTGEKPFACKLCHYKCTTRAKLVMHIRTHTGEKPFACMLCNYKCTQNTHLVGHMATHTGEKPFACKLCNYKCVQRGTLAQHMRTHTGEKPYACKLCHYKFPEIGKLVRHMRTHTDKKPFACLLCQYKCADNDRLMRHIRTHTGEKSYACKLCQFQCTESRKLVMHMRTHW